MSSPENTSPSCTIYNVDVGNGRMLATLDFDITCEITSKLDNADIKVKTVVIGTITATVAEGGVAMEGKATCEGTPASSDTTTTNSGKFIQISGFLFLFILTVF